MRILYGVVGEGMGHATRSAVILRHLAARGHTIEIVVSGRAHGYLTRTFPSLKVHEIAGLAMVYEDNRVKRKRTFWDFVKKLPAFADNYEQFVRIGEGFRPELVVSDFESFAYYFGKKHDLPVLSIDNMQIINRCRHDDIVIPDDERGAYKLAKTIVKTKLFRCDHYFITTFFFPEVRKKRTTLHPPILRDAVLDARPERGDHVLVYQTSDTFHDLIPTLQKLPGRFYVYGLKRTGEASGASRGASAEAVPRRMPDSIEELGNVTLKGFSEEGFVRDLATCRAVLAGGGFSLMGEAVQLGKPMFSVPIEGQFEQALNALYLEKLGYGEYHRSISEDKIASFLYKAPRYMENLKSYPHREDRNRSILQKLDEIIELVAKVGRLVGED